MAIFFNKKCSFYLKIFFFLVLNDGVNFFFPVGFSENGMQMARANFVSSNFLFSHFGIFSLISSFLMLSTDLKNSLYVNGEETEDLDDKYVGKFTCTQQLVEAYNNALEIVAASGDRDLIMQKWNVVFKPLLFCPSIPPAVPYYPKPSTNDALYEIIQNKEVRVGTIATTWGSAGDYTQEVPVGFFPDYLRAIFDKIGQNYGVKINIKYIRLPDGEILSKLNEKNIHMTELYFIYSNVYSNGMSIHRNFFTGCPACAANNVLLVRKDSDIRSMEDLRNRINNYSTTNQERKVLFQSSGNLGALSHMLPINAATEVKTGDNRKQSTIEDILQKNAIAAISTSYVPSDLMDDQLLEIDLDIQVAMGPLFKRTMTLQCLAEVSQDYNGKNETGNAGGEILSYFCLIVSTLFFFVCMI